MALRAGSFYISSYNAGDYDSSTQFTTTLSVPIVGAKGIRVLGATLPHLMNPFSTNDKEFQYRIGATVYNVTFPTNRRWTSISDFVTWANSGFLLGGATFTYNPAANKLSLNAVGVVSIPKWTDLNANYRLGFTSNTGYSGTNIVTSDGFPNILLRTNLIYVVTNISTDSNNDSNIGNIICKIPVDVDWGDLIQYQNSESYAFAPCFTERIKDVNIQLLDEDYQPLINPDNAYFNISLSVHY